MSDYVGQPMSPRAAQRFQNPMSPTRGQPPKMMSPIPMSPNPTSPNPMSPTGTERPSNPMSPKANGRPPNPMSPNAPRTRAGTALSSVTTSHPVDDETIDDSLLMCKICNKQLTGPKHFPCLHTFCESCLTGYAKDMHAQDPSSQLRCPTCDVPVPNSVQKDPTQTVRLLPVNYLLQAHIIKKQFRNRQCKPCIRMGRNSTAKSWCSECGEVLCDNCVATHGSIQSTTRHDIIPIEEAANNPAITQRKILCSEHPTEELVRFCMEHQQACCSKCKTGIHSNCNSFLPLDRAVEVMVKKQELTYILSLLDVMNSNTEKIIMERKKAVEDLEVHKTQRENTIKLYRQRVNEHLDSLEGALVEEFETAHNKEIVQIKTDLSVFEEKRDKIDFYKRMLEAAKKNVASVTVLTEGAKIRQQCQFLEENLQHRASKLVRTDYDIKESDMISKMQSLGSVHVRQTPLHSNKIVEHTHLAKATRIAEKRHNFLALKYPSSIISCGTTLREDLILVDQKGREVRGYSETGQRHESQICPMYENPFDAAVIGRKKGQDFVAVTMPNLKQIQIIVFHGDRAVNLAERNQYSTHEKCFGITNLDGILFVACMDRIEVWEVDSDMRLTQLSTMQIESTRVKYICAADQNRLYYSDTSTTGALFCITTDGATIFRYTHKKLQRPMGIATDKRGNVYVAGFLSNNIHELTPEGTLVRIIAPEDDGFKKPMVLISTPDKIFISYENHIITFMYTS